MSGNGLLTAREVAQRLHYKHPETVLRWRRKGEGPPAIKLHNGAVRWYEDEVDAWIEKQRATTERGSVTTPAGRRPTGNLASVTTPYGEED